MTPSAFVGTRAHTRILHGAASPLRSKLARVARTRAPEAVRAPWPALASCLAFLPATERYRHVTMRIVATRDDNSAAINEKYRSGAGAGSWERER